MRTICVGVVLTFASMPCSAQGTASVRVIHDDPDGYVVPGETVQLHVRMDWTPSNAVLWHIAGGVLATPDIGLASIPSIGLFFPSPPSPQTILIPGVPSGGSIVGAEVFSGYFSMFGFVVPPWHQSVDVPILNYEWTAPNTPGTTIDFHWTNSPAVPQPLFIFNTASGPVGTLPTTYSATSLTVIPAPASLALWAGAGVAASRRRR